MLLLLLLLRMAIIMMITVSQIGAKLIVGLPPRLTSFESVGFASKISLKGQIKTQFVALVGEISPPMSSLCFRFLPSPQLMLAWSWLSYYIGFRSYHWDLNCSAIEWGKFLIVYCFQQFLWEKALNCQPLGSFWNISPHHRPCTVHTPNLSFHFLQATFWSKPLVRGSCNHFIVWL